MSYADTIKRIESAGLVSVSQIVEYAKALEMTGNQKGSLAVFRQILDQEPCEHHAMQYAAALCRLGERDGEALDRLIIEYPSCKFLKAAKSEMALQDGDFGVGFALCKYRWSASQSPSFLERIRLPYWEGQELSGRLIVIGEQGIGEEILYSSALGLIPPAIVSADLRLQPILTRSFPQHVFVDRTALHHYHGEAVIEAMDLFRLFGRSGNESSWIMPDAKRVVELRQALVSAFGGRKLVGLSWSSSRKSLGESKSVPVAELMPLMTDSNIACINLQYGDCLADVQTIADAGGDLSAIGGLDLTADLDGVAALIGALDYVVTCSNSVAHMSGGLGVPTILLAPSRFGLWYWGRSGDRTPWYPSIEIIRKPWPEAVAAAHRRLTIKHVEPWKDID